MKEQIQAALRAYWSQWQTRIKNLDTPDKIALLIICSFFIIAVSALHISYTYYFPYNAGDKGVMYQLFYNTVAHGNFFYSSINGGMIDFAGHQRYILLLFLPFYAIYPHPLTISIITSALLALGALPVYWLSTDVSKSKRIGLLFVFIYFLYPTISWVALESVKEEIFALPLLLFAFYFMVKGSFPKFLIFLILAGLCKESIPLVIIMFGVYAFIEKMDRKWILAPLLIGSGLLAVEFFLLRPYFIDLSSNLYGYVGDPSVTGFTRGRYDHFGNTTSEILSNVFFTPTIISDQIFSWNNFLYLVLLLLPVGFISLLKPKILLIGLPILLQNILSDFAPQTMISWHYASILVFVIITSAICAFPVVYFRLSDRYKPAFIILLILLSGISFLGFSAASDTYNHITALPLEHQAAVNVNNVITTIPENATIFSSLVFGPYIYKSENVTYSNWRSEQPIIAGYDYYLFNRWEFIYFDTYSAFTQIMKTGKYEIKYSTGQTVIIGLTNSSNNVTNSSNNCLGLPRLYDTQIGNTVLTCKSDVFPYEFYNLKSKNKTGYLVYGPYFVLDKGTYVVTYSIRADNISDPNKKIATVEISSIYSDTHKLTIENKTDIYPANLTSGQDAKINLSIRIDAKNNNRLMEFRVFQPSNADLYVTDIHFTKIQQ
jgi:uncharacterized membrane protein